MRPSAVAAGEFFPARGGESYRTAANELPQEVTQQSVHRNHQESDPAKTKPSRRIRRARNQLVPVHLTQHHKSTGRPIASALYTKQIFREHVSTWFRHQSASIRGIIV
jgi:hypothetical protein